MDLLLDHVLDKKVQKLLLNQKHNVLRAFEINYHCLSNGEPYRKACEMNRILVTCDSDFDKTTIGRKKEMRKKLSKIAVWEIYQN